MKKQALTAAFWIGDTLNIHTAFSAHMSFTDYSTPKPYDYDQATRGLAEKLQAYMDLAGEQEDEAVAAGIRGTALQIYERWHHFSSEAGKLKEEDDARCRTILQLPR